jgi:hypothetical protein
MQKTSFNMIVQNQSIFDGRSEEESQSSMDSSPFSPGLIERVGHKQESLRFDQPYTLTVEREPNRWFSAFTALRLETLFASSTQNPEAIYWARQALSKTLQASPLHLSGQSLQWRFEFRLGETAGVALVSRTSAESPEEAAGQNLLLTQQPQHQLMLLGHQCEFAPVHEGREFEHLAEPFPLNWMAEIRRRELLAERGEITLGSFCSGVPVNDDWFRVCARLGWPLLVTFTLLPISLSPQDQRVIQEKRFQVGGTPGFLSPLPQGIPRDFGRSSVTAPGTGPGIFLVQINVASSLALPDPFLELLANELAGAEMTSPGLLLQHQATWQVAATQEERSQALTTVQWQEPTWWMNSRLPAERRHLALCFFPAGLGVFARVPLGLDEKDTHLLPVQPFRQIRVGDPDREGVLLGFQRREGRQIPVRIPPRQRSLHTLAQGGTGTGKTTLLDQMALQDIKEGRGVCVIDPHGDLARRVLRQVSPGDWNRVTYLDFSDLDYPPGLNLFADGHQNDEIARERARQNFLAILLKMYPPDYTGPIFTLNIGNAWDLATANPDRRPTLTDVARLFVDSKFRAYLLRHCKDPLVKHFWKEVDARTSGSFKGESLQYIVSKLTPFLDNTLIRNIVGQTKSSFDLPKLMREGGILIVNLAKGILGESASSLLGMILLFQIEQVALQRGLDDGQEWSLYLDEFHNFATEHFSQMLSEMRKFRVGMVLANQSFAQIDEKMREAILSNVGTLISFRVSPRDAAVLEPALWPHVDSRLLARQPNHEAVARIITPEGVKIFSFRTEKPRDGDDIRHNRDLVILARRNARPRAEVSREIHAALLSGTEEVEA